MNKLMRFSVSALSAAAMCCMLSPQAMAADAAEQPVILSLKSNIYGYQGPDNHFTIYFGSTEENVEIYVEGPKTQEYVYVNPYTLGQDGEGGNTAIATAVPLSVTASDNEIRIHGDASKIDYIDVHGCYLGSVDLLGNFVNLSVVDLSHNELTRIDLSEIPSLNSIDLTDNSFSEPQLMKIGTVHPDLLILSVGINEVVDPELDLRNFPNLLYFNAYNNYGVTHVDPTECPDLVSLQLDVTNISSIDVSKNPRLDRLNISQTKINSIDLSNNVALGELYINHEGTFNSADEYKLTSIDLSKNVNLEYLDLGGNLLTEIDLSNNTKLLMLYLMRNYLTSLDLSNCTRLSSVNISNNCLDFSTLPLPQDGWDYTYYQRPLQMNLKYKTGEPIDLSSKVIRAPYVNSQGQTVTPLTYATVFAVPRAQDMYEVPATKYTYENGVVTFKEAIPDSVYVSFYCTAFDEWSLNTQYFKVKTPEEFDLPSPVFSFVPSASMAGKEVGFRLGGRGNAAGYTLPEDVVVLMGDTSLTIKDALAESGMPAEPNVSFVIPQDAGEVTIALPDGFALTALGVEGVEMSSADLTPSELITDLSIVGARLPSIDLGYNSSLRRLRLNGNDFTHISLAGVRGDFEKWFLSDIDLSGNRLSSVTAVSYESIENLNLDDNAFTDFDSRYYTSLRSLSMARNSLRGEIDLMKCTMLRSLDLSGNDISSVLVAGWNGFESLDLSNNDMTLATLPLIEGEGVRYNYAPQHKMQILSAAATIDLSAQDIVLNGTGATSYVWKYAEGDSEVPSSLYSSEGGVFRFGEELLGKSLYCEMTNPLFPQFDAMPLTTTAVTVAQIPSTLVASFTTTATGTAQIGFRFHTSGDNAVYIDWRGDGQEFEPYIYEANGSGGIYRSGNTFAGCTAKVYTFGSAEDISVFALNATPISNFDGSPMTKVEAIDIHSGGLKDGQIILPKSSRLYELVLDGNAFQTQAFDGLPGLSNLNLAANDYKKFDLSPYPNLMFVQLADNKISEITFGQHSSLYQLDLTNNNLSSIDLNGLDNLQELLLADNNLSSIDIAPVKERIRVLHIAGNYFTFATLPLATEFAQPSVVYDYTNQKRFIPEVSGASVDLSAQAFVAGNPTDYRWFLGNVSSDVYYDYNNEMFVGEEISGEGEDAQFEIQNGITTFLHPQAKKVICAMTNSEFPSLILYTLPVTVEVSAVESLFADGDGTVTVYSISGVLLRQTQNMEEALEGLAPGLYVIGGKKVLIK